MLPAATETFLKNLESSHLLTKEQVAKLRDRTQGEGEPRTPQELAKRLVERKQLTRWQAQQLLAGRTRLFLGKYKLLECLGKGGMGTVFRAEQPPMGRSVALKVMSKELLKNSAAVNRFMREIRSAGALNHPHIVSAYDAAQEGDTHFLVMECAEGRSLRDILAEKKQLPVEWACECARQTALALQHATERGMVHRDIKPANLIVGIDGATGKPMVKVLDFGLARMKSETHDTSQLTHTGQILGSPDYIAPEQAQNTKTADIRSDIFSLGCTLFEMLTGQVPFGGNSVMEKLMARVYQAAPRVSSLRPDVPPALDAVVARMLTREPEGRYQRPLELLAALTPFAENSASVSGEFLPPPAVEPLPASGSLAPQADPRLDEFLNQLGDHATGTGDSRAGSRSHGPAWQRPYRRWLPLASAALLTVAVGLAIFLGGDNDKSRTKRTSGSRAKNSETVSGEFGSKDQDRVVTVNDAGSTGKILRSASLDDYRADREAANWVLSSNGTIEIFADGKQSQVYALPSYKFRLTGINLLGHHEVNDQDLDHLAGLKGLQTLILRDTGITDGAIDRIARLTTLEELNIAETEVSLDGMMRLGALKSLKTLNVSRMKVKLKRNVKKELEKVLPNCKVLN